MALGHRYSFASIIIAFSSRLFAAADYVWSLTERLFEAAFPNPLAKIFPPEVPARDLSSRGPAYAKVVSFQSRMAQRDNDRRRGAPLSVGHASAGLAFAS